jgi:hypothetical protein
MNKYDGSWTAFVHHLVKCGFHCYLCGNVKYANSDLDLIYVATRGGGGSLYFGWDFVDSSCNILR